MEQQIELSGRDETLASCFFFTGPKELPPFLPLIEVADFDYGIQSQTLVEAVRVRLGASLLSELPEEHRAVLEREEEQAPEDIALAERMRGIQRDTL